MGIDLLATQNNTKMVNTHLPFPKHLTDKCLFISADQLKNKLDSLDKQDLLTFDLRPADVRVQPFFENSVPILLPTTLMKRKSFTFDRVLATLNDSDRKRTLEKLAQNNVNILIFDSPPILNTNHVSMPCHEFSKKLLFSKYNFDNLWILTENISEIQERSPTWFTESENPKCKKQSKFDLKISSMLNNPNEKLYCRTESNSDNLSYYIDAVTKREQQHFQNEKSCLNFQKEYEKYILPNSQTIIDKLIPKWFQMSVLKPKVDIVSQFQRIEELEKKRLVRIMNKGNNSKTYRRSRHHSGNFKSRPLVIKTHRRSYSQPEPTISINRRMWLNSMENDDEDEKDALSVSSYIEFGFKNRFKNIFPYEHSRVKLKGNGVSTSVNDYINANYLCLPNLSEFSSYGNEITQKSSFNYNKENLNVRYIATQAPMKSTVGDFLSCILDNAIPLIVSLTDSTENGIEKCYTFWKDMSFEDKNVIVLEQYNLQFSETQKSNFIRIRKIKVVSNTGPLKKHIFIQIQLTNWADFGSSINPLELIQSINFKNAYLQRLVKRGYFKKGERPTILVHCTAGCGRTGTWCSVDAILSNLENFEFLFQEFQEERLAADVLYDPVSWTINIFRKQRVSIVQTVNQFIFIYDCLVTYFICVLKNYFEAYPMTSLLDEIFQSS